MATEIEEPALAKRKLILRDSLAFLSLVAVTLVLFGITLLLFRSFSSHRADLARRWSERGVQAMQQNHPDQAVVALRTALGYAPDTRSYELLLAQALGEAGRVDESYNYFMGLWQTEPGNGFINLELARLAARRNDPDHAIEFYRASIYGTWEGDGVSRRSQVRLELARYLIQHHQYAPARMELLITAGNTPDTPQFDESLGELLEQAQDPGDARTFYTKAVAKMPHDADLLDRAGRLAYQAADFVAARRLLTRAVTARAQQHLPPDSALDTLKAAATRILELAPSPSLSPREEAPRVVEDRSIAQARLSSCTAHYTATGTAPPPILQQLASRWASPEGNADLRSLGTDSDTEDATMHLVYDTEVATASVCKPATGDDALLLLLARINQAQPGDAGENQSSLPQQAKVAQ